MAFIRERDGKFSVVYKVKDDKGKVHQKSETFRKKKDAEKRKHEIEYQMDTGTFKVEKCTTIEELLAEYVKLYGREKWAVSTYSANVGLINNYILPVIGQAKVSDVNNHFVEKYYRDLGKMKAVQGANNKKNEGNVTPNTVFEIHKILRSCFRQAVKWGIMEKNPAVDATLPKRTKKKREIIVTDQETGNSKTYLIPYGSRIKVTDGQVLEAGDVLTEGSINPHDLLKVKGVRAVQDYMIREVQRVYRLQGVDIADKHIEVIVRQMLKKVRIENNGDTEFLPGTLVDVLDYEDMNEELIAEGKEPADGKQVLLGITKAALATNSFLSAASFQETTKVLTEAAIKGKVDNLIGLKENVIIGKLIPVGTGMKRYRNTKLSTDEVETISFDEGGMDDQISFDEKVEETAAPVEE